jgi:hypothetical protein
LFNVATADDVREQNCKKHSSGLYNKQNETAVMLFRADGRKAVEDFIAYDGVRLEMVSAFKCLGITIQATGHTYGRLIKTGGVMRDVKNQMRCH